MCMFGNRERRGKEKRRIYLFSFVWFAIRKKMKRKYMVFYFMLI